MAKLQQVALGLRVALQQVQQRIAESRAQRFGHIVAATLAADQQPLRHQFLDRLAQRRPGNPELLGKHALGGQPLAGFQRALQDHRLQLRNDVIRQTALPDLTKFHIPTPLPEVSSQSLCHAPSAKKRGSVPSRSPHHKRGATSPARASLDKSRRRAN